MGEYPWLRHYVNSSLYCVIVEEGGETHMLPYRQGFSQIQVELQVAFAIVFGDLGHVRFGLHPITAFFRLTPLTGLAPKTSGKTPTRLRMLWQFGAKWMAAPVSWASCDLSKSYVK